MNRVLLLLSPRWKKFRNRVNQPGKEKLRLPLIAILIIGLWAGIYVVFVKALVYFTAEEMFGTIAATKLLSMILATFAFVLIISNIITTFSTFFLSEDLELLMTAPVPPPSLYTARFIETMADSSWMVLVFGLPVFLAYGTVFESPWSFYVLSLVGFVCLLVLATALSIFVVQSLVRTFPVRRLRDLFVFVGILIFIGVYLLFRMVRPEEFLNPEGFASIMDYLSIMSEGSSPLLPTTWFMEILRPYITGYGFDTIPFFLALLVAAAASAFRLAGHNHQSAHFFAYSKSVESRGARLSKSRFISLWSKILSKYFDRPTAAIILKETLLMARDWGRLSQLLLLLALIMVYLYNFSVLPSLDNPVANRFLKNTIAFVNIGLAGFVLSSLGVRFLFPAISSEGRAFWILKGSPIGLRRILWVKYFFYLVPMLILGLVLVLMTNRLLDLELFISSVSTVTVVFLTVGVTSLSIGMGVLYSDFKEVDPNRAFSGIGGLLTMIYGGLAVLGVILLEVYPVYRIVTAGYFSRTLKGIDYIVIAACFLSALGLALYLIIKPLRVGLNKITELEI
jgi:ABC-2 type transport system permease protein